MAIVTRSFNKPYEIQDYTQELLQIPNQYGLINSLGLFGFEGVSTHSIIVESHAGTLSLIPDAVRGGGRANVSKQESRTTRAFPLGHYPLDDSMSPEDIQGKRAYGSPDAAEQEAAVLARKMARLMRSHDVTLEFARAQAITQGTIYAPNQTISGNFYTDFGVTRTEVAFDLDVTTTEVTSKIEQVIAAIQDNLLTGVVATGITMICSPTFFNALIVHPKIADAYKFYSSTQEPLRQRLGGPDAQYRRFDFGGIVFMEYRGSYPDAAGVSQPIIPVGDAYAFPTGTQDLFMTYAGPASKMSLVNTIGELRYSFVYPSMTDEGSLIQTESNFLNLVRRPGAVVKATLT